MRVGTWVIASVALLSACGASDATPREMFQISKSYAFTIAPDQSPPHAREPVEYRILVRDRESRQPIQNGEGQIFANNREGASTWDGLRYGPQIGTYFGKLSFVAAGEWAVAIRFRRDSLHPLERIDWMQDVLNERASKVP
jgi:hypothetical protein